LINLQSLVFSNSGVGGTIPSTFTSIGGLGNLDLSSNPISGPIPGSFTKLSKLTYLDLSKSSLSPTLSIFTGMSLLSTLSAFHVH